MSDLSTDCVVELMSFVVLPVQHGFLGAPVIVDQSCLIVLSTVYVWANKLISLIEYYYTYRN